MCHLQVVRLLQVSRCLQVSTTFVVVSATRLKVSATLSATHDFSLHRQQLEPPATITDASCDSGCDSVSTMPLHSLRDASSPTGYDKLLSIAEEILVAFLSKTTETAVNWDQMHGMKLGLDSVGIFAISQSCSGVVAQACGLVNLEPMKESMLILMI
ncbi:revoluta [Cucumis melo var. makuwa]|uniref:Revoluta n=1 Tax=Cucumis melo var. makuwa TaxID=1194695 RepID=A0A5D3BYZ8_CUCMM|nr:revoluta [Cucumis melo var. makuwa]